MSNEGKANDRFEIIISEDDGRITMEVRDYLTLEKMELGVLADANNPSKTPKIFTIAWMAEYIVKKIKPDIRGIGKPL